MHLKILKLFPVFPGQKHNSGTRGHQRAGALKGSINIIQNTVITVYEVESQKTDNADFENVVIAFQKKSNRYSITTFGRARMENEKKDKN